MAILIPYPRLDSTISGIVRPFQYEVNVETRFTLTSIFFKWILQFQVWIGIIFSLLILTIFLWLISRFESRVSREPLRGKTGLFDHFWFLFRVVANCTLSNYFTAHKNLISNFLIAANDVVAFTLATRLIVTAWCLTAVVFVNSYTSSLVSYLMAPKFVPVITTVQSLADSNEISLIVLRHTSVESTLFVTSYSFRDFCKNDIVLIQGDWQAATSGALAKIGAHLQSHPENQLKFLENIEDQVYYQGKAFPHVSTRYN